MHCALTDGQSAALDCAVQAVVELEQQQEEQAQQERHYRKLDEAYLLLCIALLDHPLHGYIYDSIITGFLAVLGINKEGSFHHPSTYTTHLSAIIKMAQLLLVERAVLAVERAKVAYPNVKQEGSMV